MSTMEEKIIVENVNVPGISTRVSKVMYNAMRQAMWKVLPTMSPGLTQAKIREAVVPFLPQNIFPGGAKAGWWAKNRATGPGGKEKPGSRNYKTIALVSCRQE